ncbi:unnamed protein product [Bursaphelenchus xylophilus]|uniref:(pine wood nematode) hypothetical protein n=1 Tax=Bursaphelenchus xylophilus TaxID=6326 RepID=A0A1I7S7J3_BURXY|nr:unnamed protein product [Bursaphelenchus xylophilus]CAG9111882.1 unnamed protein product [Bursaphelenchus xylophilus]
MKRRSNTPIALENRVSRMRRADQPRANKAWHAVLDFFKNNIPELHVTEQTLTSPTGDDVRKVYTTMLLFTGICTPADLFLDNMDQMDEEESARHGAALLREMQMFVEKFSLDKKHFSITDLANPEPVRFLGFLKDMIKFFNVRVERQGDLTELFQKRDEIIKRQAEAPILLEALRGEEAQLLASLDKIRRKKVDSAYQIEQMKKREIELKKEMNELDERIPKEEYEVAEEKKKVEALKERLSQQKEEINELRGKMIQSPDRQRAEMKRQEGELANLMTRIQMSENSIERFAKHIHELEQVDHHFDNFCETLNHVKQEFETLEQARRQSTSLQTKLENVRVKRKKIEDEAKKLEQKYEAEKNNEAMKQERMNNEIQQYESLLGQINERKEELAARLSKIESAIVTVEGQIETLRQVVKDYNVEGALKKYEEEKSQLENKMVELLDLKLALMNDIRKLQKIDENTKAKLAEALKIHQERVNGRKKMVEERQKISGFKITQK